MWNEPEDPTAEQQECFELPRALLEHRSAYFGRLFKNGFLEANSGVANLTDTESWVFAVFVGWLYFQRIYYDPDREDPTIFEAADSSSATEEHTAGSQASDDMNDDDAAMAAHHAEMLDSEDAKDCKNDETDGDESNHPSHTPQASIFGGFGDGSSALTPQAAHDLVMDVDNKIDGAAPLDASLTPDENDYQDPVTWLWIDLFKLYVFADKYDTRNLRMATLDIIQLKLCQTIPRKYAGPQILDVRWLAMHLPVNSPLYRVLVDAEASWFSLGDSGAERDRQAAEFSQLPVDYLSACFVAGKRYDSARSCKTCKRGGSQCKKTDHDVSDAVSFINKHPCSYHEHGENSEEKAHCMLRWKSLAEAHKLEVSAWRNW